MGDRSAHFSRKEFECRCCGRLQLNQRLLDGLEALRTLAGVPVVINAGYRCPRHNQEVGGVPDSEHTHGLAADIRLTGLSLQQMYEFALQVPQFASAGSAPTTTTSCTLTCATIMPAGPACAASMSG